MTAVPPRVDLVRGRIQVTRAFRRLTVPLLIIAIVGSSGCQPSAPLERVGIAMTPPASWRRVEPFSRQVPGVPLAAWGGPDGSSLVVYRTLPAPGGSAETIAEELANRLENLPELRLIVNRTETIGETTGARVEVVAPGTGDALAPSGTGTPTAPAGKALVPTREVIVGFHRPDATLFLTWDTPESSYARIAPDIDATLESVRFTASGTRTFYGY
jgi:hypothetical protein